MTNPRKRYFIYSKRKMLCVRYGVGLSYAMSDGSPVLKTDSS
jgi:hypothetical protein